MRWALLMLPLSLALFLGCADDKHPVTGQVTFTDGTPVPWAGVIMDNSAEGTSAVGYADVDGNFEMMFDVPGDGAPLGTYNVAVMPPDSLKLTPEDMKLSPGPGWGSAAKYRDPATSGITFTVEAADNTLDISIEKVEGQPGMDIDPKAEGLLDEG